MAPSLPALFALVGLPALAAMCGLVGLAAATGADWSLIVVAVPVLLALGHALGRLVHRSGRRRWLRAVTPS